MKYESYKDSGVEWIGKVPSHWEVAAFKRKITINNGKDYKDFLDEEIYPVMGSGGCFAYCSKYMFDGEALLLGRKGTIDKPLYINGKFWAVDTMFYAIPHKDLNCKFAYYLALTFPFQLYSTSTALPSMTQTDLGNNPIAFPPIVEQQAIASYLDKKCDRINTAINTQKKKIELLNELKQTIITNAVTKGLNPDVATKDSGVEWIGEVPNHWEVCKTLHCFSQPITDGPHETPELFPEGIPFVSAEAVSCGNGSIDFNHIRGFISEEYYRECCKKYTPQKDDVYMIKSGATTGKVAMVDTDIKFTIWSPLAVFRCNQQKMLPKFLFHSLTCPFYQVQVELGWNYGTQQNIGMRTLEKLYLIVPPINEQHDILSYLDEKLADVNSQISKTFRRIELLQELKQSIITEAVTGKIKVC